MAPQGLLSWRLAKAMHSSFDIIFVLLSQGKHKKMILKIPSNPNHSMTLWKQISLCCLMYIWGRSKALLSATSFEMQQKVTVSLRSTVRSAHLPTPFKEQSHQDTSELPFHFRKGPSLQTINWFISPSFFQEAFCFLINHYWNQALSGDTKTTSGGKGHVLKKN